MDLSLLSKHRSFIYGMSALWIVFFHLSSVIPAWKEQDWTIIRILSYGSAGVDIFFFLSGISLYFAMAKGYRITTFYQHRLLKLGMVFLLFCVPFDLLYHGNLTEVRDCVLYGKFDSSHFWFIPAILLCYLVYPLIYKMMEKNGLSVFVVFLITIAVALYMNHVKAGVFVDYNKAIGRVPIYLLGCICGSMVYQKKKVNVTIPLTIMVLPLLIDPFNTCTKTWQSALHIGKCLGRYEHSLAGLGAMVILIMFAEFFCANRFYRMISTVGRYSLEVYVVHIAVRDILRNKIGMPVEGLLYSLKFLLFFGVLTFLGAFLLGKLEGIGRKYIQKFLAQ